MTDRGLRTLERQAHQDPSLVCRLLYERARQGDGFARSRLELLGYLGYQPARDIVVPGQPEPIHDWVGGLARWGKQPAVRAALLLAGLRGFSVHTEPQAAQLWAWVDCPCVHHARRVRVGAQSHAVFRGWACRPVQEAVLTRHRRKVGPAIRRAVHGLWHRGPPELARDHVQKRLVPWVFEQVT